MTSRLYGIKELNSQTLSLAEAMKFPKSVFFVKPEHFEVVDAINPHMLDDNGELHDVDFELAYEHWQEMVEVYAGLGLKTIVLDGLQGCPDMVFCANQTFPYLAADGQLRCVISHMDNDVRKLEVPSIQEQLGKLDIPADPLPEVADGLNFEGMGDALWVPGRRFILGGFGFRTDPRVYEALHQVVQAPIVSFELTNPAFYHLDTCLSILDHRTALACREAFTAEDWQILEMLFENLLVVPHAEADSPGFACNAHCPDGKHVILQKGNRITEGLLTEKGYVPIPLATDEFVKSGGSVFCMKQILFR